MKRVKKNRGQRIGETKGENMNSWKRLLGHKLRLGAVKMRRGILFNKCARDRWEKLVSRKKHGKTEKTWACFQCWYRGGSKQGNLEWGIIDEIIFLWVGTSRALKGKFALGMRVLRLPLLELRVDLVTGGAFIYFLASSL